MSYVDAAIGTQSLRRARLTDLAKRVFPDRVNEYLDAPYFDSGKTVFQFGIESVENFRKIETALINNLAGVHA
jgi:hypothetical protein